MTETREAAASARRPGPRPLTVDHRKVTATVCGPAQVEMFELMCYVAGMRPHQLINDIVLDAIREAQADPAMVKTLRAIRRARIGLKVVS